MPRLPDRLVSAIERLDDERLPLAEIHRRVGAEADRLGVTRPSYERVRQLLHESRELRRRPPSRVRILLEGAAAGELTRSTMDRVILPPGRD